MPINEQQMNKEKPTGSNPCGLISLSYVYNSEDSGFLIYG